MLRILSILGIFFFSYASSQDFSVRLIEIKDNDFTEVNTFNVRNLQKMALNDEYILLVDSFATFTEYSISSGKLTFKKTITHKRFNYNGKVITDLCYRSSSNDFLISYKGGCIDQYFRSTKRVINAFFTSDNVFNIMSDKSGKYLYYCTGYEYSYGGMFSKTPIFEEKKKEKFFYADSRLKENELTHLLPKELNLFPIFNFDYNDDESIFGITNSNNDLCFFNKENNNRIEYNFEAPILYFSFLSGDSVIVVKKNGEVCYDYYKSASFKNPVFNFGNNVIKVECLPASKNLLVAYPEKIDLYLLTPFNIVKTKSFYIDGVISDFITNSEGDKIAISLKKR